MKDIQNLEDTREVDIQKVYQGFVDTIVRGISK